MPTLLLSQHVLDRYGNDIQAAWPGLEYVVMPSDPAARVGAEDLERIDFAFFSNDIFPTYSRGFFAAVHGAPNLKWLHVQNAGVDNPVFGRILDRGVRISTSSGSTAMPIAQSVIGGMLMLSRPFLHWAETRARKEWTPVPDDRIPPDLAGQQMTVVGLGAIGCEIARIATAIGLEVTGVRRSPRRDGDPVEHIVAPSQLAELVKHTDWLVLACPLTEETRGLISRDILADLKPGAHILNIARGEVIDEQAMIEGLKSRKIAGAYLDVFTNEPLEPESPLWEMPNVIMSPHNSAAAQGNPKRVARYFLDNLRRMHAGEPLANEVTAS